METSQADLLTDVMKWDHETLKENIREILPKMFQILTQTCDEDDLLNQYANKIKIIQILCTKFLPCLEINTVETKLLSNLSLEITSVFDKLLSLTKDFLEIFLKNTDLDNDKLKVPTAKLLSPDFEDISNSLRNILYLLESVECCVLCLLEYRNITISNVRSLPGFVLHLVEGTYNHCKESSHVYGDYLDKVSDVLSALFKRSHSTQINFLTLMDKLQVQEAMTGCEVEVINSVCFGLFKICKTVSSLDIKLVVSLWKSISRILVQYVQFLSECANVLAMILYLCTEIKTGYKSLLELLPCEQTLNQWNQCDEKGFKKSVKILGFEMKIMLSLCKAYLECLDENKCDQEIYELLIYIYDNSPQRLNRNFIESHVSEIERQVLITCEPLISNFMERRKFQVLLQKSDEVKQEHILSHTLLLLSVTKSFSKLSEKSQDYWMGLTKPYEAQVDNIIYSVFQLVEKCHSELCTPVILPGIMCAGTAQRYVSLYEHIATHICGFIGSLFNKYFSIVEKTLLAQIFQKSFFVQKLAVDCFCFMDRFGSSTLCVAHVNFLLKALKKICHFSPFLIRNHPLCLLLSRLFRFLEADDQLEIMNNQSEPVNFLFWCVCPITVTGLQSQHKRVIENVITFCIQKMYAWCAVASKDTASLSDVLSACECLKSILNYYSNDQLLSETAASLISIWEILLGNEWQSTLQMEVFLCVQIQLLWVLIQQNSEEILLRVFVLIHDIMNNNPSSLLVSEVINLVIYLKSLDFSWKVSEVLQDIVLALLSTPSCLIRSMYMNIITQFSEKIPHSEIIPDSLRNISLIEEQFARHVNKVPLMEQNLQTYLKLQLLDLQSHMLSWCGEKKSSSEHDTDCEISTSQPLSKRARVDDEDMTYETLLQNMETYFSTLENLKQTKEVPEWFKKSIKQMLEKFTIFFYSSE